MEEGAAFGERRKESEEKEEKKHNNNNNFDNYSQNVSIKSDVALWRFCSKGTKGTQGSAV